MPWVIELVKVSATLESRPFEFKSGAQSVFWRFTFFLTIVVPLLRKQVRGIIVYLIPSLCYGNAPSPISSCPASPIIISSLPVHLVKSGKFQNLCKEKENALGGARWKSMWPMPLHPRYAPCDDWPSLSDPSGPKASHTWINQLLYAYLCAVSQYPSATAAATLICFPHL